MTQSLFIYEIILCQFQLRLQSTLPLYLVYFDITLHNFKSVLDIQINYWHTIWFVCTYLLIRVKNDRSLLYVVVSPINGKWAHISLQLSQFLRNCFSIGTYLPFVPIKTGTCLQISKNSFPALRILHIIINWKLYAVETNRLVYFITQNLQSKMVTLEKMSLIALISIKSLSIRKTDDLVIHAYFFTCKFIHTIYECRLYFFNNKCYSWKFRFVL